MLNFFKSKPVLDESSQQWLFDCFAWTIDNFDRDFFATESQLILPTHTFFPARANSMHELADSVFERVKAYTGLTQWPFKLVEPQNYLPQHYQISYPPLIHRGESADPQPYQMMLAHPQDRLSISYDPVQMNQPQVMVANYAAALAGYLMGVTNELPPGGEDYRTPAIEVLAIFMGFGVMFSNTAYAFRGSCASCHNHAANRTAVLSENESVFALALFCQLKGVETKLVTPHLKSHLKSMYKQAVKDINNQPQELSRLKQLLPPTEAIPQMSA